MWDFTEKIRTMWATIGQTALPQRCVLCDAANAKAQICAACDAELPYASSTRCLVCAIPLPQAEICGECLKIPPAFDSAQAVFDYAYPVDALLAAYKFSGQLSLANLFAQKIVTRLDCQTLPDIIVPMPLHPARLRQRGFNQALEIGRVVGRTLCIPMDDISARRLRPTPAQVGLTREMRLKNMRNAFSCETLPPGQRVAIIDDVMTSGATVNSLSQVLRQAGAADIQVWLVARTRLP